MDNQFYHVLNLFVEQNYPAFLSDFKLWKENNLGVGSEVLP
jgi:hypothetical protein